MLTKSQIQNIVNQENLIVRNLQVTLGYYRLSEGMRRLVSRKNVSWLGFATHASKTAGQALRHELMPGLIKSAMVRAAGYENTFLFLDEILGESREKITKANNSLLVEAMRRVSLLVSAGNVLVFAELALPFTNFINVFSNDWHPDPQKLDAFLKANLKPGPLENDGQDYLYEALSAFYSARFESDQKRKAELILQGNLLVGFHEQSRLQPYIDQALAAPFDVFANGHLPPGISRKSVLRAVTRMWMSFTLPTRDLKLGQNVVAPTGVISFPSELMKIETPRCRQLVNHFDAGLDTLTGSAADNWGSLKDRMSFVVDFFRSHQQYKRLFDPPFLESQIPVIDAGHIPAGPL